MARGQGLGLARSPRRNPGADDYGRYLVYDLSTQEVVHARRGSPFCFEVDELEEYLTGGVRTGW